MLIMGFSLNLLTLFALVLAIGIVVDNAIVVVEAVHVKMKSEDLSPFEASVATMKEISPAILAITLVMAAVFIPVAFLSGPVGVFYRQFSVTLAVSIVISGIVALTLTPALCSVMLKKHVHHKQNKKTFWNHLGRLFNYQYNRSEHKYRTIIGKIAGRQAITLGVLLLFFVATWGIGTILPTGFIPTEDQGIIYANVVTPPGSTIDRTDKVMDAIQIVAKQIPEVENVTILTGYSIISEAPGASYGMAIINLKPWGERKASVDEVINSLREKSASIADASIEYFPPPTVTGFGNSSGFELRLIDKTGSGDLQKTSQTVNQFMADLKKSPVIGSVFSNFDASFPQYLIHVNKEMAAQKGVTVENSMNNLQTLVGSLYTTNFIRFGQMYKVMLQALPEYRSNPEDILKLYVKK
jgi:HAE1 family hydrophobic/amphiphilic exporter-1